MFQKIANWLDSCFSSSSASPQDEDDEERSKSLSVAKGRLTKAIKRLSKTLILVEQVRAAISDNQNFMEGIRYINSMTSSNYSIIHRESIILNKLNSSISAIDNACFCLDLSRVNRDVSIEKPPKNCPLLEPRMADEPCFDKIEANFRKELFYIEDYEKNLRNVNKTNRALENQVTQVMRTLVKLEAITSPEQEDSSLIDYTLPCLFFYTTPLFTASGNLKK